MAASSEYFREWRAKKLAADPEWAVRERERIRAYKRANRERVRTVNRESDERIGVERIRERNREKMRRHRERTKGTLIAEVRRLMEHAVRDGKLIKPEACSQCHAIVPRRHLHAHHNDYTKPFDVEWLCIACHGERHRRP